MLKKILRDGTGDNVPAAGSSVWVHYVGTLDDGGEKFDSSRDRGDEFKFTLGREQVVFIQGKHFTIFVLFQVIKGWDLGVATMKKGELAVLTIKPEYGYGEAGSPPKIPGGATLVFEVIIS